jgi:hypothetical protein
MNQITPPLRIASATEDMLAYCVYQRIWAGRTRLRRDWCLGQMLLVRVESRIAALGVVLGALEAGGAAVLDDRYPLAVPVEWIWFADRLGERRPFGSEIKDELRDAWGEHYGFKILNQALVPEKNARRILSHIKKLLPFAIDDLTTRAARSVSEDHHV